MAITHGDVLKIQSALDAYEKKFPNKPSPSAEEALVWWAGKRGVVAQQNTKLSILVSVRLMALRWMGGIGFFKRPSTIQ